MAKKSIIYIAAEGHSGSTLLDIILGSQKNSFSAGELIFLPSKGIKNGEYCACGQKVPKCSLWMKIIEEWNEKRSLNLDEYIKIQNQLTSNKNILSSRRLLKKPHGKIKIFINDTRTLYSIIFKHTNSNTIIDSSKAPGRILILQHLGYDLTVVHLIRRFGDVLNSNKRQREKDLEAGVEYDIHPRKTSYVLAIWILKNILTVNYSKNSNYRKIKYEDFVLNPEKHISRLSDYDQDFEKLLKDRGPFYPMHLVAGNAMRLKDHIFIKDKPMNTSYHRLNKRNKLVARCIDFFY